MHEPIDFTAQPYSFRQALTPHSRPSDDVLRMSFGPEVADEGERLLEEVRTEFGDAATVWGAKATGDGNVHWEFYWYDDDVDRRVTSYDRAAPVFRSNCEYHASPSVDERSPYVSFSFDVDAPEGGRLVCRSSTLYFGEAADGGRSIGLSYRVLPTGRLRLCNTYQVFDAADPHERLRVARSIDRSATAAVRSMTRVPWLDQYDCASIILARKPNNDALYFRRVSLRQIVASTEFALFPDEFARRVRVASRAFDHIYFDLGLDYEIRDAQVVATRIGIYGYS